MESMAKGKPEKKEFRYIYDIPSKETLELCRILDADQKWKELGAQMKIDQTTLQLIGQAYKRHQSPTDELFTKLGEENVTINSLFRKLYAIGYQRGMRILKPFVDKKYHKHLRNGNDDSSTVTMITSSQISNFNSREYSESRCLRSNSGVINKFNPGDVNINRNQPVLAKTQNLPHQYRDKMDTLLSRSTCMNHPVEDTRHSDLNLMKKEYKIQNLPSKESRNIIDQKENVNKLNESDKIVKQNSKENEKAQKKVPNVVSSLEEAASVVPIKQVSYDDILKATNNFNENNILGQGGFGIVYKGELWKLTVAIKRLIPKNSRDKISQQEVSIKQSLNELKFLNNSRFDNIVPLYAVSHDGPEPCLIYQYMSNGSLEDRLRFKNGTPPLTWFQRSHIAMGTAKGLNYLHTADSTPLVHGDIKSANILLDDNFQPKIGDFGLTREGPLANLTHWKVTTVHGTQPYLPGEYLRDHHLSTKVDVYSYGVVLLEIATGQRAYDKKREKHHLVKCVEASPENAMIDKKAGEEGLPWYNMFREMGLKCVSSNKRNRPEMVEILDQFKAFEKSVEKVRRSSNGLNQPPNISHFTPVEIQLAYDMYREQMRTSHLNPLQFNLPASPPIKPDVIRGPPTSDNFHLSQIKAPPSLRKKDLLPIPIIQQQNSSLAVMVNSNHNNSCQPEDCVVNGNFEFKSDVSLPDLSIFNQEVNGSNELGTTPSGSCAVSQSNVCNKVTSNEEVGSNQEIHEEDDDDDYFSKSTLNVDAHD